MSLKQQCEAMVSIGSNLENLSKITLNRLQKELVEWHVNPPAGFNHKATDDLQRWVIEVTGAPGTLYANVKCPVFCGISSKSWVVGTVFTHHQKCVIMDTQATGNNKKITAFIGGLDLCDGRYDTPEHRLFVILILYFLVISTILHFLLCIILEEQQRHLQNVEAASIIPFFQCLHKKYLVNGMGV